MIGATITTLDGIESGKFVATTVKGTGHLVDVGARTVTRYGVPGRAWMRSGVGLGDVTPDGEPVHYTVLRDATLGRRMYVSNADEWRLTSTVESIERAIGVEHGESSRSGLEADGSGTP